ncbi:MAG: AAA family ATPase [Polyangiaceae bacterium]
MSDTEIDPSTIPPEEERLLGKVRDAVARAVAEPAFEAAPPDYDRQLLELRDEIAAARLEDVPALVAQMERLSGVKARRAEVEKVAVDMTSPYFAHMRLREGNKERDVLIGKVTFIDSRSGVRIVDWRHAPVSQLYYRYAEGAEYEESFGGRDVEGEVVVRRTVTIYDGKLRRIQAPQGTFVAREDGWRHLENRSMELAGGQGSAARASTTRGVLGVEPDGSQRLDRHLPEISALLDPRQFELISAPDAGVVVIQGGAGSGKTTIGLHRIAYLAFQDRKRFTAEKMVVLTYGEALAAYISEVLPALGVKGVKVRTFADWASKLRKQAVPWLRANYAEDTPSAVIRLKKHPALLAAFERRAKKLVASPSFRRGSRAVLGLWAELLTDLNALCEAMTAYGHEPMTNTELTIAHRWCSERCPAILELDPRDLDTPEEGDDREARSERGERGGRSRRDPEDDELIEEARRERRALSDDRERYDDNGDDDIRGDVGVDGQRTEEEIAMLDREDDALILRLSQLLRGPLKQGKAPLIYEHLFVDEAQDLSPVELAVLLETTTSRRSVTLAGDTSQKLFLDNGFRDWRGVLSDLGLATTNIEPLRIAYRSTREVLELAREVLGPLADPVAPVAPRTGAPVEAHVFPQTGAAIAFLAEALRPLFAREPRATVGILARFPEQADAYYEGLKRSEVPYLRRVRAQDFSFKPGIDVTEIRQVKGLEFDYVVIVDANASVFPAEDEMRHLFHIAATRAAHQLWVLVTGKPSPLLPARLIDG